MTTFNERRGTLTANETTEASFFDGSHAYPTVDRVEDLDASRRDDAVIAPSLPVTPKRVDRAAGPFGTVEP